MEVKMPTTVKPEFEELDKKFEERWPGLSFFNSFGDLNGYGEIAKAFLETEARKGTVKVEAMNCSGDVYYHIGLFANDPKDASAQEALKGIHERGSSVSTSFHDFKKGIIKQITLQLKIEKKGR